MNISCCRCCLCSSAAQPIGDAHDRPAGSVLHGESPKRLAPPLGPCSACHAGFEGSGALALLRSQLQSQGRRSWLRWSWGHPLNRYQLLLSSVI